jgi:hypothetical protein
MDVRRVNGGGGNCERSCCHMRRPLSCSLLSIGKGCYLVVQILPTYLQALRARSSRRARAWRLMSPTPHSSLAPHLGQRRWCMGDDFNDRADGRVRE